MLGETRISGGFDIAANVVGVNLDVSGKIKPLLPETVHEFAVLPSVRAPAANAGA